MSWVEKELRRRERQEQRAARRAASPPSGEATAGPQNEAEKIAELWQRLETLHRELPAALQLKRQTAADTRFPPERAIFQVLLLAANDAGIGYTGDALRYIWPQKSAGKSKNFWIRWRPEDGYYLSRRRKASWSAPSTEERPFDEAAMPRILERLVREQRVSFRAASKRRFWLF